jgi:hypothetical protein
VHERPLAVVGDALDEVRPVALGVSLALLELGRSRHLSVADLEMLCKPRSIDVFSLDHVPPTSDQADSGR